MTTKIESVGTEIPGGAPLAKRGAIALSVRACKKSLKRAGIQSNDIGLLINGAVYKDENIGEPAVASFIQRDIEANPMSDGTSSTFAFDILDGGCGLITGMELINGFISSGDVGHGIIVTSDVNPKVRNTIGFKFKNSAAAILLGPANDGEGFMKFKQYEYPQHMDRLKSTVEFRKDPRRNFIGMRRMRNILTIEETSEFKSIVIDKVQESIDLFMGEIDLKMKDIDLIIPSQYPIGLPQEVANITGLGKEKVVILPKNYGPLYTTGPGFALRWAMKKGMWDRSSNIIFLGISPGIKIMLGHYKHNRSA
jgi:3-oxoacyl-[acyl-carrier-protein] synthase-3